MENSENKSEKQIYLDAWNYHVRQCTNQVCYDLIGSDESTFYRDKILQAEKEYYAAIEAAANHVFK